MKYEIEITNKFKKDYKLIKKRGYDINLLKHVVKMLAYGEKLPPEFLDHSLSGNYHGYRECHIEADWLLVYKIEKNTVVLILSRTGTHSDLF